MVHAKCVGTKIQSNVPLKESKGIRNSLKKHVAVLLSKITSLLLNHLQFMTLTPIFPTLNYHKKRGRRIISPSLTIIAL